MEAKNIIRELLKNADQLRPGQVDFVRSVKKHYTKNKSVSDKQLFVLQDILTGIVKTV